MSELTYYDLKGSATMAPSLPIQVAREIGRRIVAGTYEANTLIDEENTLADRYKVSRVVIRDAVKILVGKGLLDVRRGIGTRIKPRHEWIMLDDDVLAWHLTAPPNRDFLKQLLDIRLAFEPKASRWAAERGTDEDFAEIRRMIDLMASEKGSIENFVIADAKFHQAILKAAHNEFLSAMEGVIYSALLVSVKISNQDLDTNGASLPIHQELANAILAHNANEAELVAQRLLEEAHNNLALGL